MKFSLLFILSFFIYHITVAQQICGNWSSQDKSRLYAIYKIDNAYEATIKSSSRTGDIEGTLILRHLTKKNNQRKYKGVILAADDGYQVPVTICMNRKQSNVLKLRIKRMLIFPATIRWYKSE